MPNYDSKEWEDIFKCLLDVIKYEDLNERKYGIKTLISAMKYQLLLDEKKKAGK